MCPVRSVTHVSGPDLEELGGAGGIRTHEWRFCRPLPWATWVPRRTSKYSKPSTNAAPQYPYPQHRNLLLLHLHEYLCFAQESCGFLGRRRINVKTGAPFKTGHFRQLGNNFDVPVIVIVNLFTDGRGVNHEIVRGTI